MKSTPVIKGILAATSLSLALLTGCSADTTTDAGNTATPTASSTSSTPPAEATSATTPDATEASSSTPSAEASESTSTGGATEQKQVAVGDTFTDPETKDVIEVVAIIRDFSSKQKPDIAADGGEIVMIQVKVTPGKEYGGQVSEGAFQISWDNGDDFWTNKTRMVEDDMKAAGLEQFDKIARRDGGSKTGWIAFFVEEKGSSYKLEYTRNAAKVIGSDKTIEEFKKVTDLPAS